MTTQLIRLSQIKSNLPDFIDFEQQLISMFGKDDTLRMIAGGGQKTFILDRDYRVGRNALKVFVNGLLQDCESTKGYMEVNSRMISFSDELYEGDAVTIIFNDLNSYCKEMGEQRVKAYEIKRQTYFVTDSNQNIVTFSTPADYQPGLNQLKVYANGLLLVQGQSYDYIEVNKNTFELNSPAKVGTILIAEVISGGLQIYKCDRFPIFIDTNRSTDQQQIILPINYRVGGNNLKIYINGLLQRAGLEHDYTEVDERTFKINRLLPVGTIVEAEVTTFTVDVFDIYRVPTIINATNATDLNFKTIVPYQVSEFNLRVYYNGVLLRDGVSEDYVEVDNQNFRLNYSSIPYGSIIEYEIITW